MTQSDLRAAVDRLRAELSRAQLQDTKTREHLDALIADIERNDRIGETVRRLEVEHPTLTGCLGQIAAALSAMGI